LPKAYKPSEHEDRVWNQWIVAKAFFADPQRVLRDHAKPYAVFIPPPNVTAALHLGHALNNTIQDILVRAHRMRGYEALWMPGTDHAGIATQAVVEKRVMKEEKKRRSDFQRDEFVAKIQAFKDEYEAVITGQLQKMGCSCDWDRQRFTMDEQCAAAVREAFFILFRDGLIYRGKRLVNWDPALQTAVADDECYDEEIDGHFYYLRYPLVHALALEPGATRAGAGKGHTHEIDPKPVTWDELAARGYPGANDHPADQQAWITVATTRPETYLGDTAVAINPHDPRAKALRGMFVELPLVGRVIPIVEDSYVVLPERYARNDEEKNDPKAKMATGFLKVTPAHDPNDYEIGMRHGLPMVNMMGPDGRVSDKHGWTDVGDAHLLVGLPREKARAKVVEEFKARDLFEGSKPTRHSVKHSDRSKAIVEPYLSDQWYVRVTDPRMAQAANEVLVSDQRTKGPTGHGSTGPTRERGLEGKQSESISAATARNESASARAEGPLAFFPSRYAKTYEDWHNGIRDWCISRQLWWGHRIPVWTFYPHDSCGGRAEDFVNGRVSPALLTTLERIRAVLLELNLQDDVAVIPQSDKIQAWLYMCARSAKAVALMETIASLQRDENVSRSDLVLSDHAMRLLREFVNGEDGSRLIQDSDVLDTWFSSALWPLSTLGWPDPSKFNPQMNAGMLEAFNPSQVLCTAREIITLWVSRMVMFNGYLKEKASRHEGTQGRSASGQSVPFNHVFIHAVIQDGEGRKMSKTLGNGVDPLDIIATHGADAMRFTLCHMATNTQDVRMPVKKDPSGKNTSEKFDLGRNFATKLWNASKFALSMIGARDEETKRSRDEVGSSGGETSSLRLSVSPSLLDRWMLSRLASGFAEVEHALANYEFHEYAQSLYDLLWRDFCDWYLEGVKPTIAQSPAQQAVLGNALSAIVRMLHPAMPYVTEVIWEYLGKVAIAPVDGVRLTHDDRFALDDTLKRRAATGLLCHQAWPHVSKALRDEAAEKTFDRMRALITMIRDVRATHQVKPSQRIKLLVPAQASAFVMHADVKPLLMTFAGLEAVEARPAGAPPEASVAFTFESAEFLIPGIGGSKETEAARLTKQIADLEKSVATLEGRLANPGYADRAPPAMVQQTRDELAKKKGELDAAKAALAKVS
jgi:valyl-tRNA synthetase